MLQNMFKRNRPEIDDDVLEAANMALQDRMALMLQRETMRKLRFASIDSSLRDL